MIVNEKKKKNKNISIVENIKNFEAENSAKIMAKKLVQKYNNMKRPKKIFLVLKKILKRLRMMMSLKKTYLKKRAYSKLQTKFLNLKNLKNNKKRALIILMRNFQTKIKEGQQKKKKN